MLYFYINITLWSLISIYFWNFLQIFLLKPDHGYFKTISVLSLCICFISLIFSFENEIYSLVCLTFSKNLKENHIHFNHRTKHFIHKPEAKELIGTLSFACFLTSNLYKNTILVTLQLCYPGCLPRGQSCWPHLQMLAELESWTIRIPFIKVHIK